MKTCGHLLKQIFTLSVIFTLVFCGIETANAQAENSNLSSEWVSIDRCLISDVFCIFSLIAAKDHSVENSDFEFSYFLFATEVAPIPSFVDISISENCRGNLLIDENQNLVCNPYGDSSNQFVVAERKYDLNDSGWGILYLNFAKLGKMQFFRKGDSHKYHIEITDI